MFNKLSMPANRKIMLRLRHSPVNHIINPFSISRSVEEVLVKTNSELRRSPQIACKFLSAVDL